MSYHHTQTSTFALWIFAVLAVVLIVPNAVAGTGALVVIVPIVAFIGFVLLAFNQLTVTVEGEHVVAAFRYGWPRRRIDLATVHRVDVVRNSWWYGFGVRITPHGWLYNVWGLDAVQLNFDDGTAFRIGTDEPDALADALRSRIRAG